jgi:hypothetical protein
MPPETDIADSPRASQPADLSAVDKPADIAAALICSAIRGDRGPLPCDRPLFERAAVRILSQPIGEELAKNCDQSFSATELLDLVAGDDNRTLALRAVCYKILLGQEGRTYEEIGREFGVTRACVQEIFSNIQARHGGIRNRRDKKPEAREACRARRLGMRKKRNAWSALTIWKAPTLLLAS